jgi:hypothetical protein
MIDSASKTQILLARLTVVLLVALIVIGLARYGVSVKELQRIWQNIVAHPDGPMTFRFILQPVMAVLAALYDGIKDTRTGRSPYFWILPTSRANRRDRLYEGLIAIARIILPGLVMDAIYQVTVLKTFHPVVSVIVALVLAFVPYLILRGPIARIARSWRSRVPVDKIH